MQLQKRAYYNLLQVKSQVDPDLITKPWQIEDYRSFTDLELFQRLENCHIQLDLQTLKAKACEYSNPEEFMIQWHLSGEELDQAYLLIFELWRRFIPDKPSLSLFCDELDHCILSFELTGRETNTHIQEMLSKLEELLDSNSDAGGDPKSFFASLAPYSIHDLETFLYEYISDQIDAGNNRYAEELIEDFYPYIKDTLSFDFAEARILAVDRIAESNTCFIKILADLQEMPDVDLMLEVTAFLGSHGDPHLFHQAIRQSLDLACCEEDFQELLAIASNYFRCCDMDELSEVLKKLFSCRAHIPLDQTLDKNQKDFRAFEELITASFSS